MSLLIKNGTVVNPAKGQHEVADILVENGVIAAIGQNLQANQAEVYDATGLIVAPGLIDIHTHLREPGQEAKEDFHSGTQAAAAGGFTRVVTMANTNPALEYSSMFGKMVVDHAEECSLTCEGHMHEGIVSYEMGVKGRPAVAEDLAVARDIMLAEMTGGHIHIAHVSTKEAVDQVRRAKAKGIKVTCEVTSQHLVFTDEYLRDYNPDFKMAPPIRSEDHRQALLEALQDGTIDAIITDHAPHAYEEKDVEFCCAANGFTGLETSFAAVITHVLKTGILTIDEIINLMSTKPAQLIGVDGGVLEVGKPADISVLSLDETWTVDRNKFYTRGKSCPFDGMTVTGKAKLTVVDGKVVMKDGVVIG